MVGTSNKSDPENPIETNGFRGTNILRQTCSWDDVN